ncbi:TPA: efflux RND transporter periplasmic adaptor subunit, partial [Pseudomonas aeruginosa]|nr:efflux RND transporter periplasmic adaptor subunit [Pseudomonas aeruginosa]
MKRNFRFLMTTAMAAALALAAPAFAHDGHDHGDEAPAASSNGPQRQPDGSVFLPKPSQRQIGVRTQLIKQEPLARSHELAGKVIMDPTTGGKVQAMVMGRLVPGPDGLPQIGQSVRKGQVLAYIEPASGVLERSGQMAQVAELRAGQAL